LRWPPASRWWRGRSSPFSCAPPAFFGWIIAALVGSGAGAALGQIIRQSVGKRRGRYIRHFTLAGIVVGFVASLLITSLAFSTIFPFASLQGLLFAVLAIVAAWQFLRW
jgi:dolichol kinase